MKDLLQQLGGISPERVRLRPTPGTATEDDLLQIHRREDKLYELVNGVLVEKVMGYLEGTLAGDILFLLKLYLADHDLGNPAGADATMRLMPGLVRIPDVSFVRWEQLPNHEIPEEPIPSLYPDLAVEVLSRGNTRGEMRLKVRDYFLSGTRLVWLVDPRKRVVHVYTEPEQSQILKEGQSLEGGDVLPGLRLPIRKVFARLPRRSGRRGKRPPRA
jgi:Uma2 family endonuclease